jgi:hypothetical protein
MQGASGWKVFTGYHFTFGRMFVTALPPDIGVRGDDWFRSPSLRTGRADLPHPALRLVVHPERIDAVHVPVPDLLGPRASRPPRARSARKTAAKLNLIL